MSYRPRITREHDAHPVLQITPVHVADPLPKPRIGAHHRKIGLPQPTLDSIA
ncbi:MAG: hypothetical protein M3497_02290 [Gemmatimonadota bacterium]|nr:hypothetical protein [Gemmatimonadota bacterium]